MGMKHPGLLSASTAVTTASSKRRTMVTSPHLRIGTNRGPQDRIRPRPEARFCGGPGQGCRAVRVLTELSAGETLGLESNVPASLGLFGLRPGLVAGSAWPPCPLPSPRDPRPPGLPSAAELCPPGL